MSSVFSWIGLFLSIVFLILTGVFSVKLHRMPLRKKVMLLAGCLYFTIFFWRLSFGYTTTTSLWNVVFDTLRTFNLDADYPTFVIMATASAVKTFPWVWVKSIAPVWFSLLYAAAPVLSAIFIIELLSNFLSKLRLWFLVHFTKRELVYFSELNSQSLTLAKSLFKEEKKKPIFVFTDVYTATDDEKSSELYLNARSLGAICLRADILHIKIAEKKKKKLFLIDVNEMHNIETLITLAKEHGEIFKNTEAFVFAPDALFNPVYSTVRKNICAHVIDEKTMRIMSVDGYKNIVKNALKKVPLYEPLVGLSAPENGNKRDLNLTILGAGKIGTEMFLTAYWIGQMLPYQLTINVVSKETEEEFINKINYINPEIFHTGVRIPGAKQSSAELDKMFSREGKTERFAQVMRVCPGEDKTNEPYFKFRYFRTNIEDDDLERKLNTPLWEDDFQLTDSDYFVVSLGSDITNLTVAEKINKFISTYKLEQKRTQNTVISYAVYNSELCRELNESSKIIQYQNFMYAFGSFAEVFNAENIYMKKERKKAEDIQSSYERVLHNNTEHDLEHAKTQYDFWANVARSLHIPYKVFSAGMIEASVFNCSTPKEREEKNNQALKTFFNEILPYQCDVADENSQKVNLAKKEKPIYKELSWLEHRRWCAFMRSNGFSCPADYKAFYDITKSHKEMKLRLHACLVETKKETNNSAENARDDRLDVLCKELDCNFKKWDAPGFSFGCNDDGEVSENIFK